MSIMNFNYDSTRHDEEPDLSPTKLFGQEALTQIREKSQSSHSRKASSLKQTSEKSNSRNRNQVGDVSQKVQMTSPGQLYYAHPNSS